MFSKGNDARNEGQLASLLYCIFNAVGKQFRGSLKVIGLMSLYNTSLLWESGAERETDCKMELCPFTLTEEGRTDLHCS